MRLRAGVLAITAAASLLAVFLVLRPSTHPLEAHDITPGPDNPVVGFDMDPTGNTDTTMGPIDPCVHVPNVPGTQFTIDTFLDAVPLDEDLAGYNYFIRFSESTFQLVVQDHNFLLPVPSAIDLSEDVPDPPGFEFSYPPLGHVVTVADLTAASTPGGSRGTLGRYTFEVTVGAADSSYYLVFDQPRDRLVFAESNGDDWWNSPIGKGDDIWDGAHSPAYGVIALGDAPCSSAPETPAPTDTAAPWPTTSWGKPTPTHTPLSSPSGTGAPTPTQGIAATSSPAPTQPVLATAGDVNCDGAVDSVDALAILRIASAMSAGGCPLHGGAAAASPNPDADVDCDGDADPVDALAVLRFAAGLSPLAQREPCPAIGS